MKRFIGLMCVGLLVASLSAACGGDDEPPAADAMVDATTGPDAGPDASIPLTFESFVIDMVENKTADDTDPAAFTEFSTLPESGDPAAFDVLFP